MTYTLANAAGRAALVANDHCHDLETVSGGELGPDPMVALAAPDRLAALTIDLDGRGPGTAIAAARLGPPVPRPRNVFAIGLNYQAGTPDGIGAAQGKFLVDGDVVTTRIDGIGTLSNRCVRTTDHHVC